MSGHLRRAGSAIRSHGLWLTAVLTVGVFAGLFALGDTSRVATALDAIELWRLGAVLALVSVSYGVRFCKWEYYLRRIGVRIPLTTSLVVFVSGLMMTVTPGKAGEVWKAWFVRDLEDVPVSRTASVVGAERVTDLLALSGFALLGLVLLGRSSLAVVGLVAVFVVGIGLLQWRSLCLRILAWVECVPVVGSYAAELEEFYESTYTLFQARPLAVAVLVSLLAWGLEGAALWVILDGFGPQVGLLGALFVFGVGSVVGAVSLLPGGLAATEVSMVGLLVVLGYSRAIAVSSTLVIRVGTLWYGVALGTCVFLAYRFVRRRRSAPA